VALALRFPWQQRPELIGTDNPPIEAEHEFRLQHKLTIVEFTL
jgi:hypothetical protein